MFRIGAFGILLDDYQRVLLCHRRDYDLWNLPGGGLEPGETPWDAVIREVKEETGLNITIERLAGIYSKPETDEIVFSFVCTIVDGHLILNDEADQIEYFSFGEIPSNTSRKQVERIRDVLDETDLPVLKTQRGPSSIPHAGGTGPDN